MSQIVLDAEAFKALSSDTRLHILKALDARPLTVSELGRLLDLNKATVFEHLKQLVAAQLVKRGDEERKWVYYRLTWKGRNVLHPENVQFMLLLATATLSVGGLVAQILNLFGVFAGPGRPTELVRSAPAPSPQGEATPAPQGAAGQCDNCSGADSPAPTPRADDAALTPPFVSAKRASDGEPFWQDPNVWLAALLVLLVAASALLLFQYFRQRRRERAQTVARLNALPPPEPDED